jgi:hypothetical protein
MVFFYISLLTCKEKGGLLYILLFSFAFSFTFRDEHGSALLYRFKEHLVVLFFLHVVGVEGFAPDVKKRFKSANYTLSDALSANR